jgi:hypothetical protein
VNQVDLTDEDTLVPDINEVSNVWNFPKDGKHYWADAQEKDMRK